MSKQPAAYPESAPRPRSSVDEPRVVVVGFRKGLCAALERRGVSFALWHPTARESSGHLASFIAPVDRSPQAVRAAAEHLAPNGPFRVVIAGTESAVVPAAMLRRELGARQAPVSRMLRCHDKLVMKRYLSRYGIPMTAFRGTSDEATAEQLLASLGSPVVVKMRTGSGSRGILFARDPKALRSAPRRGRFYESFVEAEEASIESFVHQGRIHFTNVTRYRTKGRVNIVPADLPAEVHTEVLELNRRVIEALRIEWGMTHLEVFLTPSGALFGEIALRPPGGYIMDLLDLAYRGDAWASFVAVELGEPPAFPQRAEWACAGIVLHPGAGTVSAVEGLEAVRAHPAVVHARVRVGPGDEVAPRAGLGQDVGRILLRAANHSDLVAAIEFVERELVIELHQAPRDSPFSPGPVA